VAKALDHSLTPPAASRPSAAWTRFLIPIGILLLAGVFRWWAIDSKPAHFDEGINGWFADGMRATGFYRYDPTNYHGPLHFYAVFVSQSLFGRSLEALRLPAVLPSLAAVWALLALGRWMGTTTARWAALAMALSPAFVFYGRYSIHESWLVFFNILLFAGLLGLWKEGRRRDLLAVVVGITGLILTKETYLIQIGSLALAWLCLWLWNFAVPGVGSLRWSAARWNQRDLALAVGGGVLAIVFFYSGNFVHWAGLHGLWQTWAAWIDTGVKSGGHEKTSFDLWGGPLNWYWVWLMLRYEWPALLGLAGSVACVAKVPQELRLTAIYGCGLLLAYSVVPYKTPWCIIAFLWPFYLVAAGWIRLLPRWAGHVLSVAIALSILGSSFFMARLNFVRFDDPKEPYVYVQTLRDSELFTQPLLAAAARDPRALHWRGEVLLSSYFPLPWNLGDFTNIAWYGGSGWPDRLAGDFVVGDLSRAEEIRELLRPSGHDYVEVEFQLRDAQEPAIAFFRRERFPNLPARPLPPEL
jgi:uncharacterized protein (TIGR03663 family)